MLFDTRVPESLAALPGRVHTQDDGTHPSEYVPVNPPGGMTHSERQAQKARWHQARNKELRKADADLARRIEAAVDPIVRAMLEAYRDGQSIDAIHRSVTSGEVRISRPEVVRICRGQKNETRSSNSGPLTVATKGSHYG